LTRKAKVRLFAEGLPATGAQAQLQLDGSSLFVTCGDERYTPPLIGFRLRDVGTGSASGVELAWDTPRGMVAVHAFAPRARRLLAKGMASTPELAALLERRKGNRVRRSIGWLAVGVFVALPLLLVLLFVWQADRLAYVAASRVSVQQESELGQQMFEGLRGQLNLRDNGPAYEAVDAIGRRLTRDSAYRYRFHVADDTTINAYAIPGGVVVVHSGLIAATRNAEGLAGVLAHEVQHVELRHSLTGMIKQLGLSGLWLLVGDTSGLLGNAAFELTTLKFSRDAETQADTAGFDALVAAGIDPRGMAEFFQVLHKEDVVTPPTFLSTHPASVAREAALQQRLSALGERRFEKLPFDPWPPQL
jgi:Zn-dependent protease with chaperone function